MRITRRSCLLPIVFFGAFSFHGGQLQAGLGMLRGDERGVWTEDLTSVIVAKISDVRRPAGEERISARDAELVPIATLAGTFDSASQPVLTVRLWIGGVGSAIPEAPPDGATVIAVVQPNYDDPGYFVLPAVCVFMPDQKGLAVITGLGDPKVMQTIERIRAVRHKGNPATRPATQPSTRPATRPAE